MHIYMYVYMYICMIVTHADRGPPRRGVDPPKAKRACNIIVIRIVVRIVIVIIIAIIVIVIII